MAVKECFYSVRTSAKDAKLCFLNGACIGKGDRKDGSLFRCKKPESEPPYVEAPKK